MADGDAPRARKHFQFLLAGPALAAAGPISVTVQDRRLGVPKIPGVTIAPRPAWMMPAPLNDGRWTVDLWAPADGIVVNGGIRISF